MKQYYIEVRYQNDDDKDEIVWTFADSDIAIAVATALHQDYEYCRYRWINNFAVIMQADFGSLDTILFETSARMWKQVVVEDSE